MWFLSEKGGKKGVPKSLPPMPTGGKFGGKGGGHSQGAAAKRPRISTVWAQTAKHRIKQNQGGRTPEGWAAGAGASTAIQACPVPAPASDLTHTEE